MNVELEWSKIIDSLNLLEVVKSGDRSATIELISAGADVNQSDEQGWTPLNWAAGKGDLEMVRLLVNNGADMLKVGRDQRTAYRIALAAGRVEVARFLTDVETQTPAQPAGRQYTKAFRLSELRRFPGFAELELNAVKTANASDDPVVFIHHDLSVTSSIWPNESVLLTKVTPEWREFCRNVLCFKAPDDFDLIAPE